MKAILLFFGVIVVIGLILLFTGIGSYNGLVSSSQAVDSQSAQVQNVYQRRADLIPNLVQTVAGAANFEKSTLEAVTNARASVGRVNISQSSAPTDAQQLEQFQQARGSWAMRSRDCSSSASDIRISNRTPTSAISRRSWKARKIASPSSAENSTMSRRTTTRGSAVPQRVFRAHVWLQIQALFRGRPISGDSTSGAV